MLKVKTAFKALDELKINSGFEILNLNCSLDKINKN